MITKKVEFGYDYLGRRIEKKVYTYDGSSWSLSQTRRYVWNTVATPGTPGDSGGWLLLLELEDDGDVLRKLTWGRDLSGSLDGAGGIGGLLAIQDANGTTTGENHESDDLRYVYFYDANGNVGQVIDLAAASASASIKAHYEYDAYGKILVQSGSYAAANPYRFSTKPWDDETGLGYWGERYYDPRLGRWINHDPIGERGGENLYRYASNAPVNRIDARGTVDRPGCTGVPDFLENACRLECCAQHDYCFDVHNCSALTWLIPWPPECVACNLAVVGCFLDCLLHPDRDDPNRWNYYCSCHNVWFNDPSDPHMKHSSDDPDCVKTPPGPRPPPPGGGGAGCPASS